MPFRDKMRKAFGRKNSTSETNSNGTCDPLTPIDTHSSRKSKKSKKGKVPKDWPENVYKPGEPMPRPKYRGPVNYQHQQKLLSFSFGDTFGARRQSGGSQYSPMGSRLPSRRGSRSSVSGGRKSFQNLRFSSSRKGSRVPPEGLETVVGAEGDDDATNVGLSRQHTHESIPPPRPRTTESIAEGGESLRAAKTITNGDTNGYGHDQPFTPAQLTQALSNVTVRG
ncbi:MAG: hypothetical protein MMC33_002103 [Icmadophila ericetorum]|nr:hypothetical protein [Icmadophila ericetorum]